MERLVEILQIHDPSDSPVTIHQLPSDTDDSLELLKKIKFSPENRIIIDCTPNKVMSVLKQAMSIGMMDGYWVGVVFILNLQDFE